MRCIVSARFTCVYPSRHPSLASRAPSMMSTRSVRPTHNQRARPRRKIGQGTCSLVRKPETIAEEQQCPVEAAIAHTYHHTTSIRANTHTHRHRSPPNPPYRPLERQRAPLDSGRQRTTHPQSCAHRARARQPERQPCRPTRLWRDGVVQDGVIVNVNHEGLAVHGGREVEVSQHVPRAAVQIPAARARLTRPRAR